MTTAFIQTPLPKISDADESASASGLSVKSNDDNDTSRSVVTPSTTKNSVHFGEVPSSSKQFMSSASSRRRASVLGIGGNAERRSSIAPGTSGGGFGGLLRDRRQSMWGSLKRFSLGQGSNTEQEEEKKLENTYQLKPSPKQVFKPSAVEDQVYSILESDLHGVEYNPLKVSFLSKTVSDKIKAKVKQMGYDRHKLVVYVVMGSLLGQGLELTSRCIWDDRSDDCVSVKYQNGSIFAVALIFATYFE